VNAAYLMLTTAWLAGADPVPVAPAAPIVASNSGCGCGGYSAGSDCCDSGKKPGLFARLCAKKRHDDCGCESSCDTGRAARAPKCREPRAPKCRAPKHQSCDSCNSGCDQCEHKGGLLARCRGRKHHDDCGCGSASYGNSGCGCGSNGGTGVIGVPAGSGAPPEAAPAPKSANPMPTKSTALPISGIVTPVVVAPY
jgi:hypothetical protein